MILNRLMSLTGDVHRIEHCGLHTDLIKTSRGTVRIGSMPDISKFTAHHGFREEIVVIPDWDASMAGDNRTGEEFVLWQAQVKGGLKKHYTGAPDNVERAYRNLQDTFSYFFDPKRITIVRKRWMGNWFARRPAAPVYENGPLRIDTGQGNIVISEAGKPLYDRNAFKPESLSDQEVENTLGKIPRDRAPRDYLEIQAIGTGNGFSGVVANGIVRFNTFVLWIDPCGYPAHALARHGIHWDDITHIIITHNHEDHTQGFSACLKRAELRAQPLNLITAPGIAKLLEEQFSPLVENYRNLVRLLPLKPGSPLMLGSLKIDARWNHHFLPYGTLGLKFSAGDKALGYSGDTKLDEKINRIIQRHELLPDWFGDCGLVLHEIDFDNPGSVHTHWKEVEKLQNAISGEVLAYHTPHLANAPLPLVAEGKVYRLE